VISSLLLKSKLIVITASTAIYADGHALATISMSFLKDYKKAPFSKSRKVKPTVKPLPSTLASSTMASSTMAPGTNVHPFQSAMSAHPSSPSVASVCDESTHEHSWRPNLAEPDPSFSSQISPLRSAVSYPSKSSSVSLVKKNARTTPVHVPRPRSNSYSNEAPGMLITYDQNYPPGGPSSVVRTRPIMSDIQRDTIQNAYHDIAPAIFGAPSARISSELPTASHQDHPCFVSNLPKATNPSQPRTPQPSKSQTTGRVVSLPTTGVKRRLGMGRTTGGYSNKKFKPPT
jgi:hypothetical protein